MWRALALVGLVMAIAGCATLERFADRLCSIEFVHATFCDGSTEEPEGEK